MGGGEVLKKGYLIKSPPLDGGALKMWRKRWFVLLSSKVLEYYKSEGGEQKGVINLEDCHSVNSNLSHKRYKYVFNVETKERVFFLVAKTQLEMEAWVDELCKVCGLRTDYSAMSTRTIPAASSTKSREPNISQPIYATSTKGIPFTEQFKTTGHVTTTESVYSLAANADYDVRQVLKPDSADVPAGVPLSEALSSKGLGGNRDSAASGGSGGDVAANRLSETAFFTPRPGDGLSYLGVAADTHSAYSTSSGHRACTKTRSATSAQDLLTETPSGLTHRSHTNAAAYGGAHQKVLGGAEMLSNGYMKPSLIRRDPTPSSGDNVTHHRLALLQETPSDPPPQILDQESSIPEGSYGLLHTPPPIDRSNKPLQMPTPPPAVDRALKPGRRVETELSDSSEGSPPQRRWSTHCPPSTKLPVGSSNEDITREENEYQFNLSEIPRVTLRSTHYTQVDFNPDTRRPIPLPRKTFHSSGGSTPTSVVPKPRRVTYTDVDIQATNQLADRLNRQVTVREAERKALSEKHYVNVDHSGTIDDETDPDYYTHMRDFNFDEADKPEYFTLKLYQQQKQQAQANKDNSHTVEQEYQQQKQQAQANKDNSHTVEQETQDDT